MRVVPRLHLPTVVNRARADRALLLLVAGVVAVGVALLGAVAPATESAADRAVSGAVRDAGPRGTVQATLPEWYDDPSGKSLDASTATQVRQDADFVRGALPAGLRDVLRPGVVTVTTTPLQLLDAGPGRYLQLAFVEDADGGPAVTYVAGAAPRAARRSDGEPSVEVAVSVDAARALDLEIGERVPARDEHGRPVTVVVSGELVAPDAGDDAWQVVPQLLVPTTSSSADEPRTSAAALVTAASLADLRFAVPGDAIRRRVVFTPEAASVTWRGSSSLERTVASLQAGAGAGPGATSWDSLLGTVLHDARAQVAAARGQAQVLLVPLLACTVLVLVLAAQLLVRRRSESLALSSTRGASLPGIATELVAESVAVTALGAAAGLGGVALVAGRVGWGWWVPVLLVSATAPAVLGVHAVRSSGARAPANRSVRRDRARAAYARRLGVEVLVLVAAVLSCVALWQRGVVDEDGGRSDLTAAGAVTWVSVVAALLLLRVSPPILRRALHRTRTSVGAGALFVTARLQRTATRALPLVVVLVAVSGATVAAAFAATLHDGQAVGARAVVGGDARLDARPGAAPAAALEAVSSAPGVRAVAAGLVEDGVRLSARGGASSVRLVVADADDLSALLAAADLPGAAQVSLLRTAARRSGVDQGADPVPALLLGGPPALRDDPSLRWEDASIPLDVVETAPDVGATGDPVLVVDAGALAAAGVPAAPDTVWAVGPGAPSALDELAQVVPGSVVTTYTDELAHRRDAALPAALGGLATLSCVLLTVLALLGVTLAAAAAAPDRQVALGRLRALGGSQLDLRRVLLGELLVPVAVAAVVGVGVGLASAYAAMGELSLQRLTLAPVAPATSVPWWVGIPVVLLLAWTSVLALLEWRRVRRTPLARLLRT